jgi:hypothetical protein
MNSSGRAEAAMRAFVDGSEFIVRPYQPTPTIRRWGLLQPMSDE